MVHEQTDPRPGKRPSRGANFARTLLDVAATSSAPALARNPNHPGARRLTRALELYRDDELTRSDLEAIFLALCDDNAIARPLVNHIVEGTEVDFFWSDQRLIAEADGRATHLTREGFERDRARDAHLTTLGYRVLRFTERQITGDGATVAARLRAVLPTCASR